jgi:hypothetical protein
MGILFSTPVPQLWCDPQVIELVVNNRMVIASLVFGWVFATMTAWDICRSTRVLDGGATGILFSFSEHQGA